MTDGERLERIRPSPPPAPLPAREPSSTTAQPSTSIGAAEVEETFPEVADDSLFSETDEETATIDDSDEANVIDFPGQHSRRGRKKKSVENTYRVDYVKASTNTWAFRIRWMEIDGREPVVYVSRVNDKLFKLIRRGRAAYAAFKKQLIVSYLSRAIRRSDRTDASSDRSV
jgi:hypothetical protein